MDLGTGRSPQFTLLSLLLIRTVSLSRSKDQNDSSTQVAGCLFPGSPVCLGSGQAQGKHSAAVPPGTILFHCGKWWPPEAEKPILITP